MFVTNSLKIFLLSFLYYITIYLVVRYSFLNFNNDNFFIYSELTKGDNLIYFLSPDAWSYWIKSSYFIESVSSFGDFINFFINPLIPFSVKYLYFFKFFSQDLILIQLPLILASSLNIVLIYKISSKLLIFFGIKTKSLSIFLSLVCLILPFQMIWIFSPLDDTFSFLLVLSFTYFFITDRINMYNLFIFITFFLLVRYQYLIILSLFIFKNEYIKIIYNQKKYFLIILTSFISIILFILNFYFKEITLSFISLSINNTNDISNIIFKDKDLNLFSLHLLNNLFYTLKLFYFPSPFQWIENLDLKNFILSIESFIFYIFSPGLLYFLLSEKLNNYTKICIILFLYSYVIVLFNPNVGTSLRYLYLIKVYFLFCSLIGYFKVFALLKLPKFIGQNFNLQYIYYLIHFLIILLFLFRDIYLLNYLNDLNLLNSIFFSLYILNISSLIFLYPFLDRLLVTKNKFICSGIFYQMLFVSIVLYTFLYSIVDLFFFDFINLKIFKLIYLIIIPSSFILFISSILIKKSLQIYNIICHLIVPLSTLFFLVIFRDWFPSDIILIIGLLMGVTLNFISLIFFLNKNLFRYINVNVIIYFKYIILIYKKYFFPNIYVSILILFSIFYLLINSYSQLFLWINAIKIPITISSILYLGYNNFIHGKFDTNLKWYFNWHLFAFISLSFITSIFLFLFSNTITNFILFSNTQDSKDLFKFLLRTHSLIPFIYALFIVTHRNFKIIFNIFILLFIFILSLIICLLFQNILSFFVLNFLITTFYTIYLAIYNKSNRQKLVAHKNYK